MSYGAYVLTEASRNKILESFPPIHSRVICHHITVKFGVEKSSPIPPDSILEVVGYEANESVQCAVVKVNGSVYRKSDGATYHVTISVEPPAKPVDSNKLLKGGFIKIKNPFQIEGIGKILA